MKKFFMIINPTAAGGRVENIWNDQIKPLIDEFRSFSNKNFISVFLSVVLTFAFVFMANKGILIPFELSFLC